MLPPKESPPIGGPHPRRKGAIDTCAALSTDTRGYSRVRRQICTSAGPLKLQDCGSGMCLVMLARGCDFDPGLLVA
jgi:hypothetical protein